MEQVFRITNEQIESILVQLEDSSDDMVIPVECGTGFASFLPDSERIIFCVRKIYSKHLITDLPQTIGNQANWCIFVKSLEQITTSNLTLLPAQLFAYISGSDLHVITGALETVTISCIVGHDLNFFYTDLNKDTQESEYNNPLRLPTFQAFGNGTTNLLSHLTIAVAGASGTGSIVAEQLVRLGVKRLVLVDDDVIEARNLGRILNSKISDADNSVLKVEMLKNAFNVIGLSSEIIAIPSIIANPSTVHLISGCDIIFGCLDSVDGRDQLNRISTFYSIPYIDVGVKLVSNEGLISEVSGAVRYVFPGGSSLLSRKAYTLAQLESDALRRADPEAYRARLEEKYIVGATENNPAVISVNMQIASVAVLELLQRLHPYRGIPNAQIETIFVDLVDPRFPTEAPTVPDTRLQKYVGLGDCDPLLCLPFLGGTK